MQKLTNFKFQSVSYKLLSAIFLSVCIIFSICVYHSFAEVPCKINYQGRLIKDNVPVHNPTGVPMTFKVDGKEVYNSVNDGNVPVYNGLFRVVLDLENKGIDWTAGEEKSLEVTVDGEQLTPPEPIYAYPYAINTHFLEGHTTAHFLDVSGSTQTKKGGLNIEGNVGIGTSPNSKLDVSGAIKYSGSYTGTILYGNTNSTGTPTGDGFRVRYKAEFFGTDQDALVIEKTDGNQGSPDGGIAFVNTGQDGIEETALVIKGTGNVGIGTTSPEAKLHVGGTPGTDGIMFPDGTLQTTAGGGFDPADIDSTGWGNDSTGTVTFPNGLIFKWGKSTIGTSQTTTTVSFPSAFPNACFNVVAVEGHSSGFNHGIGIHTVTKDSFKCYIYGDQGSPIRWFAVGR